MLNQAYHFRLDGEPIFCTRYGSGHINETYLLVDATARQYILQKINKNVFHDPVALMKNITSVTTHLRKKSDTHREVMNVILTLDGNNCFVDAEGDYWRLYDFISDSLCLDQAMTIDDFHESAVAFGKFQHFLSDFPAHTLSETIVNFHHTPTRYSAFKQALENDVCGRAREIASEINFVLSQEAFAQTLVNLQSVGEIPVRVTHNDTKLNNVLFDRVTRKALCIIDLDTVMPGLSVNDYGDSIRFGASTAVEDERDLSKVEVSLKLFETYTHGFLSACGKSLTCSEIENLCTGAKMMTLECGIRFLTDYLSGDKYFHIHREAQNLDRCRTQLKLVADMDKKWSEMQRIVMRAADKLTAVVK